MATMSTDIYCSTQEVTEDYEGQGGVWRQGNQCCISQVTSVLGFLYRSSSLALSTSNLMFIYFDLTHRFL